MKKLPPWTGDDDAMLEWLNRRLDDQIDAAMTATNREWATMTEEQRRAMLPFGDERRPDATELEAAYRGDLGPILKKLPPRAVTQTPKAGARQELSSGSREDCVRSRNFQSSTEGRDRDPSALEKTFWQD
jgi:hypothetical protein